MSLPARMEILLAVVHFPSKLFWTDTSQAIECTQLARTIAEQESEAGHSRTVLVGDLNMNPFEPGIVSAGGLNAVMTRTLASRKTRTVQGRQYPFFYNPMWSHFGDAFGRPSGTYYYDTSEHLNYYWNIFDQVLVRPELVEYCRSEEVRILTRAGDVSLVSDDGRPNRSEGSDHLPVLFELDL